MKDITNKSSVLLSIFKRKGGEGLFTKIITDENKINYFNQLALLEKDETPLICFKEDDLNWLSLTDKRILESRGGVLTIISLLDLIETSLAVQEELKNKVVSKESFTKLALRDNKGKRYILQIEKGEPYQGLYQVFHHIALKNRT